MSSLWRSAPEKTRKRPGRDARTASAGPPPALRLRRDKRRGEPFMFKKFLALAVLCLGTGAAAQPATRSILYVANSQGDDITVIDLPTQKVITTLKVGPIVHGICAQGDGRKAFATIESEHSLKVIDTRTNTVTDTIALGGQPN